METTKKGSGIAFLPLLVFMVIYVGAGVYFQLQGVDYAFYQFPAAGAMVISIFLAFVLGIKKEKFQDTLNAFVGGIANNDIITMLHGESGAVPDPGTVSGCRRIYYFGIYGNCNRYIDRNDQRGCPDCHRRCG